MVSDRPPAQARGQQTGGSIRHPFSFSSECYRPELREAGREIAPEVAEKLTEEEQRMLKDVLKEDPRPAYQDAPDREYGFQFAGKNIRFSVSNGVLIVLNVAPTAGSC